jgi:hypothetical protein
VHLTSGVPCDKVLSPTTGALRGDGRARWGAHRRGPATVRRQSEAVMAFFDGDGTPMAVAGR